MTNDKEIRFIKDRVKFTGTITFGQLISTKEHMNHSTLVIL